MYINLRRLTPTDHPPYPSHPVQYEFNMTSTVADITRADRGLDFTGGAYDDGSKVLIAARGSSQPG